jgi:hypothetical protein
MCCVRKRRFSSVSVRKCCIARCRSIPPPLSHVYKLENNYVLGKEAHTTSGTNVVVCVDDFVFIRYNL